MTTLQTTATHGSLREKWILIQAQIAAFSAAEAAMRAAANECRYARCPAGTIDCHGNLALATEVGVCRQCRKPADPRVLAELHRLATESETAAASVDVLERLAKALLASRLEVNVGRVTGRGDEMVATLGDLFVPLAKASAHLAAEERITAITGIAYVTWTIPFVRAGDLREARNRACQHGGQDDADFEHDLLALIIEELESAAEREQVEQVFGHTGGELSDARWGYLCVGDVWQLEQGRPCIDDVHFGGFRYWYEGCPEWATDDFTRDERRGASGHLRTVVLMNAVHLPAEIIFDTEDGRAWRRVKFYTSEGEPECPMKEADNNPIVPAVGCWLCEGTPGEEHGVLGFGGYGGEAVYRRVHCDCGKVEIPEGQDEVDVRDEDVLVTHGFDECIESEIEEG